ncbi:MULTISPECIES: enoyl-CoA hydratase/isomerase family protein [unclassified Halomonas]|uniref:enoyl-CoA hydratase/isomerase family protein n=1 Tax=unclassified Halomonas TaxID=2609666 RepID=UPI002887F83E|nr:MULTISPECIES: enoyl-CoA hydratase/isomerase family protein [unclassified Halomonas]MDT0500579.1 enoyl-CoA hydratase/isomerase family protein [Halomonas sp. PAR7]MDT0511525.1 enoyl-CoA hydratase/isomerase family protein [Halomonas sp. LES1]MDT0590187.1 enoyl-CoA hydratase/isomerase family protein [Halomonas sp. PAR8]
MTDLPVLFEERPTADGGRIGVATLNAPRSLNSLSLEMARQLDAKLEAWSVDRNIVAVWIEGSGEKAFCAGGDVVALYRALNEEGDNRGSGRDSELPATYFTLEYRLDYRIHTFPKPVMVWADGIVMGGGLGLTAGASHRLVTETTLIAMPEITIGLYPDIGASWFLNRMPPGVGAYLGLTGAQLNARDALDLGLGDHFIPRERRAALLDALGEADFGDRGAKARRAAVQAVIDRFEAREQAPEGQVSPHQDTIQALVGNVDVETAVSRILADDSDDKWLAANRKRLASGCPISAHLVWRMLERHAHTSLADAFRDELMLSVQCGRLGDFVEGVRALLIDKDKNPRWTYRDVASVPATFIDAMFESPWTSEEHPLRDLGHGQRVG